MRAAGVCERGSRAACQACARALARLLSSAGWRGRHASSFFAREGSQGGARRENGGKNKSRGQARPFCASVAHVHVTLTHTGIMCSYIRTGTVCVCVTYPVLRSAPESAGAASADRQRDLENLVKIRSGSLGAAILVSSAEHHSPVRCYHHHRASRTSRTLGRPHVSPLPQPRAPTLCTHRPAGPRRGKESTLCEVMSPVAMNFTPKNSAGGIHSNPGTEAPTRTKRP